MQLTAVLLAALSGTMVMAACPTPAPTLPACASTCLDNAASAIGCKGAADFACQCKSSAALSTTAVPCIISACGPASALAVSSAAASVCSACNS